MQNYTTLDNYTFVFLNFKHLATTFYISVERLSTLKKQFCFFSSKWLRCRQIGRLSVARGLKSSRLQVSVAQWHSQVHEISL